MSETTRFEPPPSEAAEPFWQATRDEQLVLPWCTACERAIWYPRPTCPHCLGTAIEWRPAAGTGTVYAVSLQHRPAHPKLADRVPYAVALVDLAEGVRMMSEVLPAAEVQVGDPVRVTWEPLSDGRNLPLFERTTSS
jgi:uncharacterized OB-fold protein